MRSGDAGAAYLFAGDGGFAGPMHPRATLVAPGARSGDQLGFLGLDIGDVTGDGKLDVVAGVRLADLDGVLQTGVIYLFSGASGFTGALAPAATLTLPERRANDYLDALQLADVTGDGVLDIVGHAYADVDGVVDAGALYVYAGGAMAGTLWPTAVLTVPGARPGDPLYMGLVADVSGDGVPDVLGRSPLADVRRVADAGALYLWLGSRFPRADPAPLRLAVPGARPDDELGS